MSNYEKFLEEAMKEERKFNNNLAQLELEMANFVKDKFHPLLISFLEEYPTFKALTWTQYIPHFNDGEPCTFSIYDFNCFLETPIFTEEDADTDDYGMYEDPLLNPYADDCYDFVISESFYGFGSDKNKWRTIWESDVAIIQKYGITQEAFNAFTHLCHFIRNNEKVMQILGEGLVVVTKDYIRIHEHDHE